MSFGIKHLSRGRILKIRNSSHQCGDVIPSDQLVARPAQQATHTPGTTVIRLVNATILVMLVVDRKVFRCTSCLLADRTLAALRYLDLKVFGFAYAVSLFKPNLMRA
jgi:hypothetical protein